MQNIIQLLPDSIANQIAAGEVVQRPASVVKELLENAVDAGAKSIQLIVRDAGRTLVQVVDDGKGMTETDARMSFERHATSKIRTSDDLFKIKTMGFRGEALASIAAVAQVEMRTRRADDELGTLVRIEGSETKAQEAVSCLPGTNILVKNLFFNVPARRNFLKSNSVEMRHIIDEFQRVSLANPEVAFSLYHNDQEVFNLPGGKLSRRIVDMFGKAYREQLAQCDEQTPYVSVHGYIGKPESARKTRNEQYFFVNNRYIKHNYLHHAVVGAYEGLIPESHHPFYVLFIEIDPQHIDINIHPTKTEIKFDDERSVYAIMMAAVRKAMGVYSLAPSLDFDSDVNFLGRRDALSAAAAQASQAVAGGGNVPSVEAPAAGTPKRDPARTDVPRPISPSWGRAGNVPAPANTPARSSGYAQAGDSFRTATPQDWQGMFESKAKPSKPDKPVPDDVAWLEPQSPTENAATPEKAIPTYEHRPQADGPVLLGSRANQLAADVPDDAEAAVIQVKNRYLLTTVKTGLLLIDQRGAYERILYDQFHAALSKRNGASQQLLFPKTVTVSVVDYQLALEVRPDLESVGFQFDEQADHTFLIRGIPAQIGEEREEELFANLLAQLREDTGRFKLDRSEALARSLARRSAGRFLKSLTQTERRALIAQLFASTNPSFAPGGEAITTVLASDKLAGLFK
jgi:DNA mismatch repair protein MutL